MFPFLLIIICGISIGFLLMFFSDSKFDKKKYCGQVVDNKNILNPNFPDNFL